MNWFAIALAAPALWALSNHIDKYLLERYFKHRGAGLLMLFSCAIAIPLLPIIYLIEPGVFGIAPPHAAILILSGMLYIFALLPYLHALAKDETSVVTPIFQSVPIFVFVLGYLFLGETLTSTQVLAGIVIILAAAGITLDLSRPIPRLKVDILFLMLLSSFMMSLTIFLFKFVAIDEGFWVTSFWEYAGLVVAGLMIWLFVPSWRTEFVETIRESRAGIIWVNAFNEIITIIGILIFSFASLLAPVALVSLINGFQPAFAFLFGVVLTLLVPHLVQERLSSQVLIQKVVFIAIIFGAGYVLQASAF